MGIKQYKSLYSDFINKTDVFEHCQRVAILSSLIADQLQLNNVQKEELVLASLFHDIGKIQIPDEILYKRGPLTNDERLIIEKHSLYSYNIISSYEHLSHIADVALYHHEDYDGRGYPERLTADNIPLYSRIIRVADVFDALCSDRPYRKKCTIAESIDIMNRQFKGKFDPYIYKNFIKMINNYGAKIEHTLGGFTYDKDIV